MERKRKMSPWLLIPAVIIGALVLMFVLLAVYYLIFPAVHVYDREGFISAANSCENAVFTSSDELGEWKYESSECYFVKTLIKVNETETPEVKSLFEGKSLMCQYNYGEFEIDWIDSLSEGIGSCQGPLKEAIGELILFS